MLVKYKYYSLNRKKSQLYIIVCFAIYIKTEDPPEANTNTYIVQCCKITVDQSKTIIDHSIKWYTTCPDNPNHS